MLFAGWKVRIVKNCDRGLENIARGRWPRAAFSSPRSQFFTIRTDPKPVNNLFIFFPSLKRLSFYSRHTHASVTVTVVGDRKIRTALRTNQIAEFITVTAWKKNKCAYVRARFSVHKVKIKVITQITQVQIGFGFASDWMTRFF